MDCMSMFCVCIYRTETNDVAARVVTDRQTNTYTK